MFDKKSRGCHKISPLCVVLSKNTLHMGVFQLAVSLSTLLPLFKGTSAGAKIKYFLRDVKKSILSLCLNLVTISNFWVNIDFKKLCLRYGKQDFIQSNQVFLYSDMFYKWSDHFS